MKKALAAFLLSLAVPLTAQAALIVAATGTNSATGSALSATASFDIVAANTLQVTLSNVGGDVLAPSDILTGIFFNASATFTPMSAWLGSSTVLYGPTNGGNVGGEWAHRSGFAPVDGATQGISSTGLGIFGNGNFGGSNLAGPIAVNGLQYGITSASDLDSTGNSAVRGGQPLIKSSVIFTLGFTGPFTLADLSHFSFQYGTSLSEPRLTPPVRTPDGGATLGLLGAGLLALGVFRRRTR